MKKVRMRHRPGFQNAAVRWLYRILYPYFHCRVNLPEELKKSEEPVVFIANHYDVFGPVSFILSMPLVSAVWMNEDIITPETAIETCRPGVNKTFPFLGKRIRERIATLLGHFSCGLLKQFGCIPVDRNNPGKLLTTMRKSVAALEAGNNILIFPETGFPEYSLTSVTPFFSGFATLGRVYQRKTGKDLKFYPCYIDEQHHQIRLGEPEIYNPEAESMREETERVSDSLNARIREMAALSRGVEKEEKSTPVRRTILFFCNLIRLVLLVPLLVMVGLSNPTVLLVLYAVSQGLRILFNAVVSNAYSASNRVSSLFSHALGLITDICVVGHLTSQDAHLAPLLVGIILNALVIMISNAVSLIRIRKCAGVNYFDTLSGHMICFICLCRLANLRLNRMMEGALVLGTLVFLACSAGFAIAFNARMKEKDETLRPEPGREAAAG